MSLHTEQQANGCGWWPSH